MSVYCALDRPDAPRRGVRDVRAGGAHAVLRARGGALPAAARALAPPARHRPRARPGHRLRGVRQGT